MIFHRKINKCPKTNCTKNLLLNEWLEVIEWYGSSSFIFINYHSMQKLKANCQSDHNPLFLCGNYDSALMVESLIAYPLFTGKLKNKSCPICLDEDCRVSFLFIMLTTRLPNQQTNQVNFLLCLNFKPNLITGKGMVKKSIMYV